MTTVIVNAKAKKELQARAKEERRKKQVDISELLAEVKKLEEELAQLEADKRYIHPLDTSDIMRNEKQIRDKQSEIKYKEAEIQDILNK